MVRRVLQVLMLTVLLALAGCGPTTPEPEPESPTLVEAATPPPVHDEPKGTPTPTPIADATPAANAPVDWLFYDQKRMGITFALPAAWKVPLEPEQGEMRLTIEAGESGIVEFRVHMDYDAFPETQFKEDERALDRDPTYKRVAIKAVNAPGFIGAPSAQWRYRLRGSAILLHDIYLNEKVYSLRLEAPDAAFPAIFSEERIAGILARWEPRVAGDM